jgi:thiocyanate desulfurase
MTLHICIDTHTVSHHSHTPQDIWALFDRRSTEVKAAFRYDWAGNTPHDLSTNWIKGGRLTITRIYPDKKTGKFDL